MEQQLNYTLIKIRNINVTQYKYAGHVIHNRNWIERGAILAQNPTHDLKKIWKSA